MVYMCILGIVRESPELRYKTGQVVLEMLVLLFSEDLLVLSPGLGKKAILPSLMLITSIFQYCKSINYDFRRVYV